MDKKRLYRSEKNKKLCGVCGGVGEYLNIDPTIIRLLWILLSCAWGTGILVYFVCAIVMPQEV